MAVEANINFDDDDDQEYNENDTGDTSFDPSTFGDEDSFEATNPEALEVDSPNSSDKAEPFNPETNQKPVDVEKLVEAEIRKADQANRRLLREQQAEERRRLKERNEDEARRLREAKRQEKATVQEQITSSRSNAVTQRVQAYSVSAALGMPGYIGAAAFDQFVIRPEEQKQVEQNKAYQVALDNYYKQLEKDRIKEKRAEEERIRQMPVEAVDVDAIREKHGLPPSLSEVPTPEGQREQPTQPQQPTQPDRPQEAPQQPTQPQEPDHSQEAPQQPTQPQTEQHRESQQQAGSGGPPHGGPPPNKPTGQQPESEPPPVPPTPPAPPIASNLGTAAQIAAIAIQAAQMINGGIRDYGEQASKAINSTLGDDPYDAARQHAKFVQKSVDPFGVNIPAQIAVTGFDMLLSLTEEIKKNSEKDLEFSPLSLSANVEGEIQKLMQSMDLAQRLDPTKAEIIRLNTQVDLAWNEFKTEVFEGLAPQIIGFLRLINISLEVLTTLNRSSTGMAESALDALPFVGSIIRDLLARIEGNTRKNGQGADMDKANLMAQISKFLDPNQVQPFNRPAAHPNPI